MHAFQTWPSWLRQLVAGLGLFLAGGLFAFGYSYRPLHGARVWKIEQLEARLHEVGRENLALADELARLRTSASTRVDPETVDQLESELEQTKTLLGKVERRLETADRKRQQASSEASRWRRRFETLQEEQSATPAAPASAPAPTPVSPSLRGIESEENVDAREAVDPAARLHPRSDQPIPGSPTASGNAMLPGAEAFSPEAH